MSFTRKSLLPFSLPLSALAALLLSACGQAPSGGPGAGPGGMKMPPPQVGVVTITKSALPITALLPGRIEAARTSDVRARVAGIILQRAFREGSEVNAGELLYRIDPASFQAALDGAKAQQARAEATLANAQAISKRATSLIASKTISQQDYDTAVAGERSAAADVLAAKAAVETAKLNLGYASVTAPISGRIGRAMVTEGALVGQGEATPLAQIQQVDKVYVNFSEPSAVVLKLRRAMQQGRLKGLGTTDVPVSVVLEDGSEYAEKGHLLFSDLAVDPGTGAVALRGEIPNPDRLLLPGMFVQVKLGLGVADDAITVPQRAVMRTPDGASVMVVGADGNVAVQPIKTDMAQGDSWIVTEGLKGGEKVIVDGLQKVKPGAPATAVPADGAGSGPAAMPAAPGKK
jgi:membrane fusion protein (multidrug efflux system)